MGVRCRGVLSGESGLLKESDWKGPWEVGCDVDHADGAMLALEFEEWPALVGSTK